MSHYEPKEPFDGYDPDDKYPEMMDFIIRTESLQANALVEWILERLNPKSVIDVGCGPGIYLLPFQERGLRVLGIDACHIGGECLEEGNFQRVDLRFPFVPEEKFDLAICFEVAEHLERHWSERLVDTLSECADVILFTGAVPGQGGTYHINEQPHEFWLDMFKERHGYVVHPLQDNLREFLATLNPYRETEEVSGWLIDNTFILIREEALCTNGVSKWSGATNPPELQVRQGEDWNPVESLLDIKSGDVFRVAMPDGQIMQTINTALTTGQLVNGEPTLYAREERAELENAQSLIPPDGRTIEEATTSSGEKVEQGERTVLVLRDGDWVEVESMMDMEMGDVFRLVEPDGKQVSGTWKAVSAPGCVNGAYEVLATEPSLEPVQTTTEETPEVTKVDEIVAGTGDENPKPKRTRKAKSKEE